mmetsp:Transcript_13252/g.20061  ORF Transcript_13252/g.20061 Transcript_13252/m.20061 type:complete len:304 (+) Transcript_13252:77-988(+)|eukprot:CAMPEP_0202713438 /NCGR_PEP_ID=MMETSP1385-20130828/53942_1 /ASSEMBLY_ACC=CAM_ASM_000861 /TAXON_ID=933848 /ORGANISM="Elphidium margaritaceum" /LENGTH=303 /DNA_ID=CAMNT_0049373789 /DNA_START=72 /DNA_END=983 /DNA_ORIENTATION=-
MQDSTEERLTQLKRERCALYILRRKVVREWSKIQKEREALKQERRYVDEQKKLYESQSSSRSADGDDSIVVVEPGQPIIEHAKCHRLNIKLKSKLKKKTQECQALHKQIDKLRSELRESHEYYERFLEYEKTIVKQKFDIRELKTMNRHLLDRRCECDTSDSDVRDMSRSRSKASATTSEPARVTHFVRTPLKCRPAPGISSSNDSMTRPSSPSTSEELSQQIEALRQQIADARATGRDHREDSGTNSFSRSFSDSSSAYRGTISYDRNVINKSPIKSKSTARKKRFWRLFGICVSSKNDIAD